MVAKLPRNVALVRVEVNGRPVVLVNPRLNHDQQLAARVAAALLATQQPKYVLITCSDVLAALHAAAA